MNSDKPFKLSVEHWDTKITIEKDHSDISWDDYVEMLIELSRAVGWSNKKIDELFKNY